MTLTLIYMAIPAYLLIGCILMLVANFLVDGCITRKEFVQGMIVWPIAVLYGIEYFGSCVITRIFG